MTDATVGSGGGGGDGATAARVLETVRDDRLRELVEWFFAARGVARVAARSRFDPVRFPRLMPHFFMYEFEAATRAFRLRLAGEEIRQMLPKARRGATLEEVMPTLESHDVVRERYLRVVEGPAILVAVGKVFIRIEGHGIGERLVLPLADEDGAVHQILGATVYWFGRDIPANQRRFAGEDVEVTYFPL